MMVKNCTLFTFFYVSFQFQYWCSQQLMMDYMNYILKIYSSACFLLANNWLYCFICFLYYVLSSGNAVLVHLYLPSECDYYSMTQTNHNTTLIYLLVFTCGCAVKQNTRHLQSLSKQQYSLPVLLPSSCVIWVLLHIVTTAFSENTVNIDNIFIHKKCVSQTIYTCI